MAPSIILKCSGPSFPVGFSTRRTWRLTVAFMAFPFGVTVVLVVVGAIDRLSADQLPILCAALDASRRARISQREHFGKGVYCRKLVASPGKSDKLSLPQLTGVRNVQQV